MLDRAIVLREPLNITTESFKELKRFRLSDDEWKMMEDMTRLLEPFEQRTLLLSKGKFPSLSQAAAVFYELYEHLESYSTGDHSEFLVRAAKAAIEKLNKYYPLSDGLVYILGLVLDPRCKLVWYKATGINAETIKEYKRKVLQYWDSFYKSDEIATTEAEPDDLVARQLKRSRVDRRDEFRAYLATPAADPSVVKDTLAWWKEHETVYPNLAKMARDILACSATGVPVERLFSLGTRPGLSVHLLPTSSHNATCQAANRGSK